MADRYTIEYIGFEEETIITYLTPFPASASDNPLEGSGEPSIMESVNTDDDKTTVIKSKRLLIGFNSGADPASTGVNVDVETFSGDELFLAEIHTDAGSVPFVGNLVYEDNQEAFQPQPNPVQLVAVDGLNTLRDVELTIIGDPPVGHYSIIELISLCLRSLRYSGLATPRINVIFNLVEKSRLRFLSANFNITATDTFRIPYEHLGFLEVGDTIEITDSDFNDGTYTIIAITPNPSTSIDIQVSTSTFVLETSEVYIFRSNGHTFEDIYLDALTFEKDVNTREDCLTVLSKILDALGCFITFDNEGWWIIRWDEYDGVSAVTTLRKCVFTIEGLFDEYQDADLTKIIATDYDPLYEGYMLSMDSAVRRFQKKYKEVKHVYNYGQPREVPCNSAFLRGTVDDDVLPLKTYDPECWTLLRGFGAHATTPNSVMQIWVRFDDNDNEDERYLTFTPQSSSGGEFNYGRSEAVPIDEKDKFTFSFNYSADSDNAVAGPATVTVGAIALHGDDGSYWILGDNSTAAGDEVPEWKTSDANHDTNADYYQWFISGSEDLTEWRTYSIAAPPAPVSGLLYIHFFAAGNISGAIDDFVIRYNNVRFDYVPFINGQYAEITGQSVKVSNDNGSPKKIEHEMFIGEPGKRIFKGALKKFDGTNFVLTETWLDRINTTLPENTLAWFIVFQWWNTFRKNRTLIETDVQGMNQSEIDGIPGLIHRWQILHGGQEDKYFMMTSLRAMNFRTSGWQGVFVETSDADGDRAYDDTFEFKYIQ